MRNIFRNIRFKSISENKLAKYLSYAIGEILLIVIGILIALQLGNWDEKNKRKELEIKLLNELVTNLTIDSIDHVANISVYRTVENSADLIVKQLENKLEWHDSMATHYPKLYMHGLATLNTSAYENLESLGFDLITNDSIRIALSNHYKVDYNMILSVEKEISSDNMIQVMLPVFLTRIRMSVPWKYAVPNNYNALFTDLEFIEMVRWKKISSGLMAGHHEKTQKKTMRLINMIRAELKN